MGGLDRKECCALGAVLVAENIQRGPDQDHVDSAAETIGFVVEDVYIIVRAFDGQASGEGPLSDLGQRLARDYVETLTDDDDEDDWWREDYDQEEDDGYYPGSAF